MNWLGLATRPIEKIAGQMKDTGKAADDTKTADKEGTEKSDK